MPFTVVLPVLNEADNLADALASVNFAADILVVDSGSADSTVSIARHHGARVVTFDPATTHLRKKAWTLASHSFPYSWVFFLDADERVTPALRDEICRVVLESGPGTTGAYVDRELVFMGRRMRSFSPNWNLRLFKHRHTLIEDLGLGQLSGTGDNEVHEHFQTTGHTEYLAAPLLHHDYRGIGPWIERHNRYATWEAHLYQRLAQDPLLPSLVGVHRLPPFERKRKLRQVWVRLPARPALRFVVWYFGRRGFMDGLPGFYFCVLMAWYELLITLKLRELRA